MIYFDKNKQAYGSEIPEYIATIDEETWQQYAGTDKWDIVDGKFSDITNTEEYKAKQETKEKERIGNLKCTKRVFALMLQELGVDYITVLLPLIKSNPQAKLEWDLCVELERKNPLLDVMAGQLGITPEQLDGLFKYANGEITLDEFKAFYVVTEKDLPDENTTSVQENTDI